MILLSQGGNNKQWGCGHSSLKQERKGSALAQLEEGREKFCDLELNLQTMMTSTSEIGNILC